MLSIRNIAYSEPILKLECVPGTSAELALEFDGGGWQSALVSGELVGTLTVPAYTGLQSLLVELTLTVAGSSVQVVLDDQYLRGGGGRFRIHATDDMIGSWRSGSLSCTLGISVECESPVQIHLIDLCLQLGTEEDEWEPGQAVPAELEPCLLRSRYCGERQAEPFILFQETVVAALHRLDCRTMELAEFPTVPDDILYRTIAMLETLAMLQRQNL